MLVCYLDKLGWVFCLGLHGWFCFVIVNVLGLDLLLPLAVVVGFGLGLVVLLLLFDFGLWMLDEHCYFVDLSWLVCVCC